MLSILDMILILGILLLIPSIFFLLEVFSGIKPAKSVITSDTNKSSVILIPAHDEEDVLGRTLSSIKQELGPNDSILVIADNCSDKTADIARGFGCNVIERHDSSNRGK